MTSEFHDSSQSRPLDGAERHSKSIVDRVGTFERDDLENPELPVTHMLNGGLVPAPPPFVAEDEPSSTTACPHCRALIPLDDDGITYCPRCRRVLVIAAGSILEEGHGAAVTPGLPCPACGSVLKPAERDPHEPDLTAETDAGPDWQCRHCGFTADNSDLPRQSYSISSTDSEPDSTTPETGGESFHDDCGS